MFEYLADEVNSSHAHQIRERGYWYIRTRPRHRRSRSAVTHCTPPCQEKKKGKQQKDRPPDDLLYPQAHSKGHRPEHSSLQIPLGLRCSLVLARWSAIERRRKHLLSLDSDRLCFAALLLSSACCCCLVHETSRLGSLSHHVGTITTVTTLFDVHGVCSRPREACATWTGWQHRCPTSLPGLACGCWYADGLNYTLFWPSCFRGSCVFAQDTQWLL